MQPTDLMKQWADVIAQFSHDPANVASMMPHFNVNGISQTMKASLQVVHEMQKANAVVLDSFLQKQLQEADLNVVAKVVKESTELSTSSFQAVMQLQLKAINGYAGVLSSYMQALEKVRSVNDVAPVQNALFMQLQESTKANIGDMMETLTAIQASNKAWTEKLLGLGK